MPGPGRRPLIRRPPLSFNAWLRYDLVRRAMRRVRAGATVLEIGAGSGAISARLAVRYTYVGIEADAQAARIAAERVTPFGGRLVHGDATTDIPSGPYEVVCAFEVLEHLADDAGALAAWRALLAPGGLLVISVPAHQRRYGPWDDLVGHHRRYDPPDLETLLHRAGFMDVHVVTYGFPLGYALEYVRDRIAKRRQQPTDAAAATAHSGRLLQPVRGLGLLTMLATAPFRLLQRPFGGVGLGTGIVAWATSGPSAG